MGEKYVVAGMKAKCSEGTMENYLTTDTGHGVVYQGQPVLNANDHQKDLNLTHFGECKSKKIYEEARKEADEKYKAEEGDGFFTKIGKGIAKAVTKASISIKENFMVNKCDLDTPLPWTFTSKDHMIDGAPALTMESQCACRYGGIITIVPEEDEVSESANSENEDESGEEMSENTDVTQEFTQKEQEMKYINKYVNPESLALINEQWADETLTEKYGESFFSDLRESMYETGITSESSVLMFLCSVGVESMYGTRLTELYNHDGTVAGNGYTINTRGAGLIQVTGKTQKAFLEYLSETMQDGDEKKMVEEYIKSYSTVNGITDNSYNATEFIADNYAIESTTWYWGVCIENVATFERNEEGEIMQTNMSINDYIELFSDKNMDNVFLASQYAVNGRQGFAKGDLEDMCKATENLFQEGNDNVVINEKKNPLPNGWDTRSADWENAKELMENEE